jgi:hypothetical protein
MQGVRQGSTTSIANVSGNCRGIVAVAALASSRLSAPLKTAILEPWINSNYCVERYLWFSETRSTTVTPLASLRGLEAGKDETGKSIR